MIVCSLCPLHFFYSFLYYTDVASVFFTLSAWLAASHHAFYLSGVLAAVSVLMRQTNAVWIAFIAARVVLDTCLYPALGIKKERKKKTEHSTDAQHLYDDVVYMLQRAWILKKYLMEKLWPLASVVVSFAVFVMLNGGITVGDKENHIPVRHWMQPLYFALYCTTLLFPFFWNASAMRHCLSAIRRQYEKNPGVSVLQGAISVTIMLWCVNYGTLIHPFLLADNRHYTFYIWRRVVNMRPWVRYALIPAYLYSIQVILYAVKRHALDRILLAGTVCLVLVPAYLIEFRYFSIPFYALVMLMDTNSYQSGSSALKGIAAFFMLINVATLYMFLFRPFVWADGSIARFLW